MGDVFFLFRRKERTKEKPIGYSPANVAIVQAL